MAILPVPLEVVSKYQIRLKGPASQRDFAPDLFKLMCSTIAGRSAVALRRESGYGGTSRESAAYMGILAFIGGLRSATNIGGPLEPFELLKSSKKIDAKSRSIERGDGFCNHF
jgi:hypothetical protein